MYEQDRRGSTMGTTAAADNTLSGTGILMAVAVSVDESATVTGVASVTIQDENGAVMMRFKAYAGLSAAFTHIGVVLVPPSGQYKTVKADSGGGVSTIRQVGEWRP